MIADIVADLARTAQYAGAALPFGGFVFLLAVARPVCRGHAVREAALAWLRGQVLRLARWGLAAALLAMLAWLWTTAAGMSGEGLGAALAPTLLATVASQTRFGEVWCLRLGLAALLAVLLWLCGRRAGQMPKAAVDIAALILAGALLATIALAGHAFAEEGWDRIWHLASDLLHLLGAGAWLGALPFLALLLARARKEGSPAWLALARDAVPRFSAIGMVAVAVIILSGIANSWFLVGTIPALFDTAYGQVLLLKLALFLLMLALAATNRWRLTPALGSGSSAKASCGLRQLCRNAVLEAALGLALLVSVGVLVGMTPAIEAQSSQDMALHHRH